MARPGPHSLNHESGTVHVCTYREGLAQKIGHDLVIDVPQWTAAVEVADDGGPAAVSFEADTRVLRVREGRNGLKPLSDKDRAVILENVGKDVLRGQPVSFRSSSVERDGDRLGVAGELTLAGTTRPATFELTMADDGRVSGTLPVTQSEWGIAPFRGLMGALRVRDSVDVVIDLALPAG